MTVYIKDIGIINALGHNKLSVLSQLIKNESLGHATIDNLISGATATVCSVKAPLPKVPEHLKRFDCRFNQLIFQAYLQIEPQVTDAIQKYGAHKVGIVIGTTAYGGLDAELLREGKSSNSDVPDDYDYTIENVNSGAEFLSLISEARGISYTISTACTSSGKAMIAAKRYLENNMLDAVIVGGCDTLAQLATNGFDALQSLDADITTPFSVNRKGINIGEGACLMLLTKEHSDIALLGTGETSDAYHISSPDPEGIGAMDAMINALEQANLNASDIAYINLHGTGTPKNDIMEAKAVNNVFGPKTPCSSSKGLIGHTLGAASAQEVGLCWLLLSQMNKDNVMPAHLWDGEYDPELEDINLLQQAAIIKTPYMMSNSFAFGGSNVSIIIGKPND